MYRAGSDSSISAGLTENSQKYANTAVTNFFAKTRNLQSCIN